MNKKILISLTVIAAVAAIGISGTIAYFSDTETSGRNLFSAGTIDIHVDGDNFVWTEGAELEDMKPCYTDYINFTIHNGDECIDDACEDINPVNVWKHIKNVVEEDGLESEPECTEQEGVWMGTYCIWDGIINENNISSINRLRSNSMGL